MNARFSCHLLSNMQVSLSGPISTSHTISLPNTDTSHGFYSPRCENGLIFYQRNKRSFSSYFNTFLHLDTGPPKLYHSFPSISCSCQRFDDATKFISLLIYDLGLIRSYCSPPNCQLLKPRNPFWRWWLNAFLLVFLQPRRVSAYPSSSSQGPQVDTASSASPPPSSNDKPWLLPVVIVCASAAVLIVLALIVGIFIGRRHRRRITSRKPASFDLNHEGYVSREQVYPPLEFTRPSQSRPSISSLNSHNIHNIADPARPNSIHSTHSVRSPSTGRFRHRANSTSSIPAVPPIPPVPPIPAIPFVQSPPVVVRPRPYTSRSRALSAPNIAVHAQHARSLDTSQEPPPAYDDQYINQHCRHGSQALQHPNALSPYPRIYVPTHSNRSFSGIPSRPRTAA